MNRLPDSIADALFLSELHALLVRNGINTADIAANDLETHAKEVAVVEEVEISEPKGATT